MFFLSQIPLQSHLSSAVSFFKKALGNLLRYLFGIFPRNSKKELVNSTGEFVDKQKHGLWTYWYENGQKSQEGNYVDDKQEGLWTYWHENGQKKSEEECEAGTPL